MTTIYIAGPMTGIPEFNFPAFHAAEAMLKAEGHTVVNPARHDEEQGLDVTGLTGFEAPDGFDLTETLLWDLEQVAHVDVVYLLRGWENSKGARAEVALARALGKEVWHQPGPRVVGLGGLLASGKDAVADHLVDKHGFVKLNMSEPLHEAMLALDPYVAAVPDCPTPGSIIRYSELVQRVGYTEAKTWPEVRALLQRLGTDVGRNMFGENVWTDIAARKIDALTAEGRDVVITGLRFHNELEMVAQRGTTVWVSRPVENGGTAPDPAAHESETSLRWTDFSDLIENVGSLADLHAEADWRLGLA